MYRRRSILRSGLMLVFLLIFLSQLAPQALAWEREPNNVFAERRAKPSKDLLSELPVDDQT